MGKADPRLITAPFLEDFEDEAAAKITFKPNPGTTTAYSGGMAFEGSQSFRVTAAANQGTIESEALNLSATPLQVPVLICTVPIPPQTRPFWQP
mgnify:CR=1 FL=1